VKTEIGRTLLALLIGSLLVQLTAADDLKPTEKSSKDIKIELKDFKFKLANPDLRDLFTYNEDEQKLCYFTNGAAEAKFKIPEDGDFDLIIAASGDSAMKVFPKFRVVLDDKPDEKGLSKETSLKSDDMKDYKFNVPLKKGEHKLSIAFTNDTYKEGEYDSNFYVHAVKFTPHKPDDAKKDGAGGKSETK
jgi:hypothetical protein